jgi:hypothetical protein
MKLDHHCLKSGQLVIAIQDSFIVKEKKPSQFYLRVPLYLIESAIMHLILSFKNKYC